MSSRSLLQTLQSLNCKYNSILVLFIAGVCKLQSGDHVWPFKIFNLTLIIKYMNTSHEIAVFHHLFFFVFSEAFQ